MAGLTPIPLSQAQPLGERVINEAPTQSPAQAPVISNTSFVPTAKPKVGLRDYQHAAKTFASDNFRLFPKQSFLFHLFIELNPSAIMDSSALVSADSQRELSLMVKSVDLPKFSIDTKTFNAYNRPNIIQNKIKYDPITINFHDDSADVVRKFWYDYYSYYYRDADHADPLYGIPTKYTERHTTEWGYSPRKEGAYIKSIKIYSFHQKQFSEYILFNPIITSWTHGKHNMEGKELLDNIMSVSYESVQYKQGSVSENTVDGFGSVLHYDQEPSPNIEKYRAIEADAKVQAASLADMRRSQSLAMTSYNVTSLSTIASSNLSSPLAQAQASQYRIVVPVATTFDSSIAASPLSIPSSTRTIT